MTSNYDNNVLNMLELCNARDGRRQSAASFAEALGIPFSVAWSYLSGERGNVRQVASRFGYDVRISRSPTLDRYGGTYAAWGMSAIRVSVNRWGEEDWEHGRGTAEDRARARANSFDPGPGEITPTAALLASMSRWGASTSTFARLSAALGRWASESR